MDGHAFGLIELLLVFGIAIGWAAWEIRSTSRSLRDDREKAADEAAAREREPHERRE